MTRKYSVVLMAAALLAVGCGQKKESSSETVVAEETARKVEVQTVSKENVPQIGVYSTTVLANVVNNIAPQTANRIDKINVEIGDFVEAGQILAEMDDAQLVQAELKLKNSEDELARVQQLYKEGGVSLSDFEQMELSCKVAQRSYSNLLENTVLRSPITGVVTARNYDVGDLYSMAQPLFTVQEIVPVKLLVAISETDYTKVHKGDAVSVSADALPGKVYSGRIIRLYPTMDAGSHTFNAEVQVRNERRELRPGMFVRATVNFGSNFNVTVPDNCLLKQQGSGQRSVFVLCADGTAESRIVIPGRHFDSKYEILSGLEEGEKVIVKGQSSLRDGTKVEVIK